MPAVCLYFQAHQPNRLLPYDFFRIGEHQHYEDDGLNARILAKVCEKCYLPANRMFLRAIEESDGEFLMALSISGVLIEQLEMWRPDVLESFRELVATGCVELLAETYYHSLAFVHSKREFVRQVGMQMDKLQEVFGVLPRVFRNTELIYSDEIAQHVELMGFDGILAEGVEWTLNGETPNELYRAPGTSRIVTILRNIGLSDDLGFRFSDRNWSEWPLTPEKFAGWLKDSPGDVVNLFLDYESIGEHQSKETGIFDFWEGLPTAATDAGLVWTTPSEMAELVPVRDFYRCHFLTSWADAERDLSAWMGNVMQQEAIAKIHRLEERVLAAKDPELTHTWAKLQTSDHFYYISTKQGTDGDVHGYFSPYGGPYDAYIYFMNVLADLQVRLKRAAKKRAEA
jgi:alpha-amylase